MDGKYPTKYPGLFSRAKEKVSKNKGLSIGIIIVAVIVVVIIVILIFSLTKQNHDLVHPSNCDAKPMNVMIAVPDRQASELSTGCPNNPSCTYQVTRLAQARSICRNLGEAKCKGFQLTGNTMIASTSNVPNQTDDTTGTDFYGLN